MPNNNDSDDAQFVPFEDKIVDKNLTWYLTDEVHDRIITTENSKTANSGDPECQSANQNQETVPSYFVPADVFLGGFKLAQFENLIEFINVDPHSKEEELPIESEPTAKDANMQVFEEGKINFTNCGKTDQLFPIIDMIDLSQEVDPGAHASSMEKIPEELEMDDADDVVFVREYSLTSDKSKNIAKPSESTGDPLANTETHNHQLRGRKLGLEKRKNPVRKAHIEKVQHDLIEKLSYHPSVFNAKVKKRKAKQPIVIDQANIRQSCRTTGAIYSPPSPITFKNYKEWPTTAHEMPCYNEKTQALDLIDNAKAANRCDSLADQKQVEKPLPRNTNSNLEETMTMSLANVMIYLQEANEAIRIMDGVSKSAEKNAKQKDMKSALGYELFENTCLLYSILSNKSQKSVEKVIMKLSKQVEMKKKFD